MLKVTFTGLDTCITVLQRTEAGLEGVPKKVSADESLKRDLQSMAVISLIQSDFGYANTGKGTTADNMRAATTQDGNGIVVYEELNPATKPHAKQYDSPYSVFALPEHVYPLSRKPTDFMVLWPELMKPIVVDAYEAAVKEALRK